MAAIIAAATMTHVANRVEAALTNDLKADWSDTHNPNGPWSYNEGNNPLPHTGCVGLNCSEWTNCQPAWARGDVCPTQGGSNPVLPNFFKAITNNWEPLRDIHPGDIVMHSHDNANGGGNGEANITWTASATGFVTISGGVWDAAEFLGRGNDWRLYHNATLLTGANIFAGDPYSRAQPFDFRAGSGGTNVLRNIPVKPDDVIKLLITRTSQFGNTVGMNWTVIFTEQPAQLTYDLRTDWSDTQNPNGPWSYNEGNNPLPHTGCAFLNCSPWTNCQPAWARGDVCPTQGGNSPVIPAVFKAIANDWEALQYDIQPGDIILHSRDDANGSGNGEGNITWTASTNGFVTVSGGVWSAADFLGRGNHWSIHLNATILTEGDVSANDAYSRAVPFDFRNGSAGSNVLQNISVNAGDIIKLLITRTTQYGDVVGINLTVVFEPEPGCVPAPSGLVSAWSGGNGTIAVDSVGGHHACLQGAVGSTAGKVGQAFLFDGSPSSFIRLPNSSDFQPASNQLTIAAWIKPNFSSANGWDTVLTKRGGCDSSGISYFLGVAKGDPGFNVGAVQFAMSTAGGGVVAPSTSAAIPKDGQYHHIAGTYDGSMMRTYLDGQLIGEATRAEPIVSTTAAPVISHHGGGCPQRANAAMDEIQFYNRALSSNEVAALHAAGSAGECYSTSSEPRLELMRCETTCVILWPAAAVGYVLEDNADVSITNGWNAVTHGVVPVSDLNTFAADCTQGTRFYRLRK